MTREDRAVIVDASAMVGVGVFVCFASHQLTAMTVLVAFAIVVRLVLARLWVGRSLRVELPFFVLCALLGGGNDWNTVVRHGVYQYTVPTDLHFSTIPLWMLAYWGIVLRAIATLASWPRLGDAPSREGWTSIGIQLALVLVTRQAIYRLWAHSLWSWVPFAIGLVLYAVMIRPGPRARRLASIALLVGPPVEMAFIHLGGLHRYALGWLFGVPVWIALWWVLGVLVWADLAPRIERTIGRHLRREAPAGNVTPVREAS